MASYEAQREKVRVRFFESGNELITDRLDQYVLRVLPQDLLTVLRGVAAQELNAQIDIDNNPTQILVDGRSVAARGILEATRSVSMRFADVRMLLAAARDAYSLMQQVTRIQSPPKNAIVARQNFHLYVNGKPLGVLPAAFSRLTEKSIDEKSVIRIVGPLVNYGRKLYWSPIGSSKVMNFRTIVGKSGRTIHRYDSLLSPRFKPLRMRTLRRAANNMPGDKAENLKRIIGMGVGSVEGANQIVKRLLRRDRRYKALHISDGWISYPPAKRWGKASRDDRVPTISVQLSRKGAVRVINLL